MSDHLPESWVLARLADVCEPVSQRGPSIERKAFRYIDLGAIDNKAKRIAEASLVQTTVAPSRAKQIVHGGDIVFSTVRVYLENIAEVPDELDGEIASTAFCILRPAPDISSRYLYYYVTSRPFVLSVNRLQRGNSPPSVQDGDIRSQLMPLAPPQEQKRIASRIDELFSRIDEGERALEQVQRLVKRYRQSLLKAAVTGELTRDWREKQKDKLETGAALLARILKARREAWEGAKLAKFDTKGNIPANERWRQTYVEPPTPETGNLSQLPHGWTWGSMEQVGEVRLGRQRAPQHHTGDHMRPYLRVANVYEDHIDLSDVMEMNFTPNEFKTYELRYGDILLNEGQSPELVGRPAMYRGEIPGCCYQKTLLRFRAHEGISPNFALFVFRSYLHSGRFRRSANITTSIAHLAAERFVRIEFPIPSRREQSEIVERASSKLSELAHLECELSARFKAVNGLRQSVLRSAFSGQLLPQHPTDEPASCVLARIANNRVAASRNERKRSRTNDPEQAA